MTYDDWIATDPSAADYCSNGHYHCEPCPFGGEHPGCECGERNCDPEEEPTDDTSEEAPV
jgi:hypothetical protein